LEFNPQNDTVFDTDKAENRPSPSPISWEFSQLARRLKHTSMAPRADST
jgi:hypothetical protein